MRHPVFLHFPVLALLSVTVRTDTSQAPDLSQRAEEAKSLCGEWYVKAHELFNRPGTALEFSEIRIAFDPELRVPGRALRDTVFLSPQAVRNQNAKHIALTNDWSGLIVHECVHLAQNYKFNYSDRHSWVVDGMADYVRYKLLQDDLEPALRLNAKGYLSGYGVRIPQLFALENKHAEVRRKGYRHSYSVAAAFLYWLYLNKDQEIFLHAHEAFTQGKYSDALFRQWCGAPLADLWKEFLSSSGKVPEALRRPSLSPTPGNAP